MEELKKEEKVARTRKNEGKPVIKTHVTKSNLRGWKVPMTWTVDFEGATPQQVLAMAAEHAVIKARAKYGVKDLTELEAREKYATFTVVVKDLDIPADRAPREKLNEDDKRVMALVKKFQAEDSTLKFTAAYRMALDEIEMEEMEAGEKE